MANISNFKINDTTYEIIIDPPKHTASKGLVDITIGKGTSSNYGHITIAESYTAPKGAANSGVGLAQNQLYNMYNRLKTKKAGMSVVEWSGSSTAANGFQTTISASTGAFYFLSITVGPANQSGIFYINSDSTVINLYRAPYTISGQQVYILMSIVDSKLKFSVSSGFGGSSYTMNIKGIILQ